MPNPPTVSIQVSLASPTKLQANPPVAKAPKDEEPTLEWSPVGNIEIRFIGFDDPVGGSNDLGEPQKDPQGTDKWIASDRNRTAQRFPYTIYALNTETGAVISSDPEIENEGKSGESPEEIPDLDRRPEPGPGPGRA